MKEEKTLIYVQTIYSLLISLILAAEKNKIFLFDENSGKAFLKSIEKLKSDKYEVPNLKVKKYFSFLGQKEEYDRRKKIEDYLKNNKVKSIYFVDHLEMSQYLMNNFKKNIYLIEEGTKNYNVKVLEKENKKIRRFGSFYSEIIIKLQERIIKRVKKYYKLFGSGERVDKIYLTGILPIPDIIKEKVEIIDIEKLWEELEEKKKKEILNIFNVNLEGLELLRKEKEKILLITQPLSEDGIIKEKEKIELYKEILLERRIKKVFIKPHPREKTNYIEVFKNIGIEVKVLPNEFPAEIFMLLDMNFKKVITIFSTAVLNFKYKYEIEFIGTKKYSKLYERFGDISLEE